MVTSVDGIEGEKQRVIQSAVSIFILIEMEWLPVKNLYNDIGNHQKLLFLQDDRC